VSIAHRVRHCIDHHPVAGEVVAKLLREGRTESNAKWADFIPAPAPTPKTRSYEPVVEEATVAAMADDPNYPYNKAKDWNERLGGSDFNCLRRCASVRCGDGGEADGDCADGMCSVAQYDRRDTLLAPTSTASIRASTTS
jgi:hypothetical protein